MPGVPVTVKGANRDVTHIEKQGAKRYQLYLVARQVRWNGGT